MNNTVVAVIVVTSPKVFTWLGHMPVVNWSYTQLAEVRGLDRVVCVADKKLAKRAAELFAKDEIETFTIPDKVLKNGELDRWLCAADGPASDATVLAVVNPNSPFLPAAKIEGCISLVLGGEADTSCTARKVSTWTDHGKTAAFAESQGCRVFSPPRVAEKGRRFRPVTVSLIESLDVTDPDNHLVAKSLIAEGHV